MMTVVCKGGPWHGKLYDLSLQEERAKALSIFYAYRGSDVYKYRVVKGEKTDKTAYMGEYVGIVPS